MKKSIEINLGGRIFNIDDDAYELLNEYIESLRANFKDNEEGEEIVADIELRLGELCEERMHDGRARIIDYAMVAEFTERMGRPDSIADVEEKHADDKETPSSQDTPASDGREPWRDAMLLGRRLFRDTHNSLLGGVFSGLAAYSGINVWLLRVAAILLTLFVLEIIVPIVYLIAWLALPYAKSVTDRMRMREIKPQPGESREDAWRREYERSTAEVLNNAGATDNKGCLSGCLISLALFILLPIILFLILFANIAEPVLFNLFSMAGVPDTVSGEYLLPFGTLFNTMLGVLIIVILLIVVIYFVMRRNGKTATKSGKVAGVIVILLIIFAAIFVYVKVDRFTSTFGSTAPYQNISGSQTTMEELTDFVEKLRGLAKSPELKALKDYFMLADNYIYSKKCTRILWHHIPSVADDSVVPFVSECTELDDKVIWQLMPRDEWVEYITTPASVSQIKIVARTVGTTELYCVVDTASQQMWIDLSRCSNAGNVQVETNSIPGWQVEIVRGSKPAKSTEGDFALSLKSYRDVKIIKGALPKLTIFGTVNGCEEKKKVLHTVYRTRKFED